MEKIITKVGSCTPTGELKIEEDSFMDLYEERNYEISSMPDSLEKIESKLSLADFSYQQGYDVEALRLYEQVFRSFPWECTGKERELFERAIKGLSALCCSEIEYVWEVSSQIVGDYNIWKRSMEEEAL